MVSIRGMRKHHWFSEVAGVLLLLLAVITLLALVSYDVRDSTWFDSRPKGSYHNAIGWVGSLLSEGLLQLLGVAAFMVPVVCVGVGWNRFRGKGAAASYGKLFGYTLLVGSLAGLLHLLYGAIAFGGERFGAGGNLIGAGVGGGLTALFGSAGATLVAVALLASSILVTTKFSFAGTGRLFAGWARSGLAALGARWKERREARSRDAERRSVQKKHARRAAEAAKSAPKEPEPARSVRPSITLEDDDEPARPAPKPRPEPRVVPAASRAQAAPPPAKQSPLPMDPGSAGVALPSLDLLNEVQPQEGEDEKELLERAQQLTDKFREFAVEGTVVAIHPGPVVTTFEYKPEAGVKYSKITGLVDDLCLGLKAESVRIDRIPGRSTVGIEVPNRHQETIFPRELLASEKFRGGRSPLTLALGKDISGEVFTSELDRMPHLLIAGATGAGKSVGLNGMITSILYKATPQDVRFIMIDTKMIELGIYADIPHLLVPVVTDPKAASTALKWAVREMEQRYRKLASVGVRNLDQFNALLASEPGRTMVDERTAEEVPLRHLPRIVIVIDEMADLMMVSSADVEESVMRLAQMARAVGIHLILATQRPSVDVITGTIKANFPARIAFRVSQRVDSRTIIDQQGAEHLLGRGDMLFLPPGSARLVRIHGGYITEAELNRVVAFLKKQAKPVYDESVLKEPEEERGAFDEGERDAMFVDAVRCILQEGQCSITLVQRRLRLGYARAARIVDRMEQEGIVGPADGSKPREVLVGPEVLESLV